MNIYVVQKGDTLQSIAETHGVSINQLIQDNGITNPADLNIGQSIVISKPELIHVVREGDTLQSIATRYNTSLIRLLANNPYLSDREYLYPGDVIVISYNQKRSIVTHGNTIPYINKSTLVKTLPYLTYLSILNYTATQEGDIRSYYNDSEIIQTAKAYGVAPLMLLTTLTIYGEANIRIDFDLLLNEEFQNTQIENILNILKLKGYMGLNLSFQYLSVSNAKLYQNYLSNVTKRLNQEGYPVFVTINPNITEMNKEISFEEIDYSLFDQFTNSIIFMSYEWAKQTKQPSPISSILNTKTFLEYILNYIPSDKVIIGIATLGYDWELPYVPGISSTNSISYDRISEFAKNYDAEIKYDELSQTPYFIYKSGDKIDHIVWFIDARLINASLNLVTTYDLQGISVWNITIYNPQLWLIINSQFEIEKIL